MTQLQAFRAILTNTRQRNIRGRLPSEPLLQESEQWVETSVLLRKHESTLPNAASRGAATRRPPAVSKTMSLPARCHLHDRQSAMRETLSSKRPARFPPGEWKAAGLQCVQDGRGTQGGSEGRGGGEGVGRVTRHRALGRAATKAESRSKVQGVAGLSAWGVQSSELRTQQHRQLSVCLCLHLSQGGDRNHRLLLFGLILGDSLQQADRTDVPASQQWFIKLLWTEMNPL